MILPSCPPDPDQEFVNRALMGDTTAFDALVCHHNDRIHALVYHMTGQFDDTRDLVQEIWIRVHASLSRFRSDAKFQTWLHQVAVNHTLNFLKRRKSRAGCMVPLPEAGQDHCAELEDPCKTSDPGESAALSELRRHIQRAIAKLSEPHRAVVRMFDIQGMPHREIAMTLGTSEGTVRSRLHYAHQLLQAELHEIHQLWS